MKYSQRKKFSTLGWVIPFFSLIILFHTNTLGQTPGDSLKLKGKFELAITPRFYYSQFKNSPTDTGEYYRVGWHRIQGGFEFRKSQYVHLLVDFYSRRTNKDFKDKYIHSLGFGLQYSIKFTECLVQMKPFRLYKKPIRIRWYPELHATIGAINLANENFVLSGLYQSEDFNPFFQYGIGLNFYLEKWMHLSLLYFQEYFPSENQSPYRFYPLQLKMVFKI